MKRRNLIWQVLPPWVAMIVVAMLTVTWFASAAIKPFHDAMTRSHLLATARLLAQRIEAEPHGLDPAAIDVLCREYGQAAGQRFTVMRPDGRVLGDSEDDPERMDNHRNRPEVRAAMAEGVGSEIRRSDTVRMNMMYVAVAVARDGAPLAVVRSALSLAEMDAVVAGMQRRIVLAGLVVALAAALLSILVVRRITNPLRAIERGARSLTDGQLSVRLPASRIVEIDVLAEAMNDMAAQLEQRIRLIREQRDEYQAVLSSMNEAVLAVDRQKRLIKFNASAEALFQVQVAPERQPEIAAVIRNADLLAVVDQALQGTQRVEGEVRIERSDKCLMAHAAPLRRGGTGNLGAVVVLHDVTQLRRLETMRRDFVANVSHELKTPITSIRGFAETLIDGAMDNRKDCARFIAIIRKQAERLQSIIDDLLALSRIEHDTENRAIELVAGRLDRVVKKAVDSCRKRAEKAGIRIKLEDLEPIEVAINAQLLEQAVLNLVDNAIKYSARDTEVRVGVHCGPQEVEVRVVDQGPGIAARHQPRIFERFYRVDKGRSRDLGGTGLGLAIVKRIAIAHGGRIEVRSEVGRGSAFSIHLPRPTGN